MTTGNAKAGKQASEVEVPEGWPSVVSRIAQDEEFRNHITSEFLLRATGGDLTPPVRTSIRCAYGHFMMFGNLLLGSDGTRPFFVPDPEFVDGPTNGVWVWGNGNPMATDRQQIINSGLRLSLTCPQTGCSYRPEIQHAALSAAVMASVLAGEFSPLLLF